MPKVSRSLAAVGNFCVTSTDFGEKRGFKSPYTDMEMWRELRYDVNFKSFFDIFIILLYAYHSEAARFG
jgi:hypothetical protein